MNASDGGGDAGRFDRGDEFAKRGVRDGRVTGDHELVDGLRRLSPVVHIVHIRRRLINVYIISVEGLENHSVSPIVECTQDRPPGVSAAGFILCDEPGS
jgi:hypothetical protein